MALSRLVFWTQKPVIKRVPKKDMSQILQPPAPESLEKTLFTQFFEASLFANFVNGRVELNHSLTRHLTLPRRLSRLSEQALGYGIFALLLCPRSRR